MIYNLDIKFIYRKRDKVILMAFIYFFIFVLIGRIKSLTIVFFSVFSLIFFYRFIIVGYLKKKTKIFLDDEKIIFNSPLIKKSIYFSEIVVLAFSKKKGKVGDLILNLNGLQILNQYWNNLIVNAYGYSDNSKLESILIPDVIEVEEVYSSIFEKLKLEKLKIKEIEFEHYKIVINESNFIIYGKNSEIVYLETKKMVKKEGIIEIKLNDPSLNNKTFQLEEIPPLKFIK